MPTTPTTAPEEAAPTDTTVEVDMREAWEVETGAPPRIVRMTPEQLRSLEQEEVERDEG